MFPFGSELDFSWIKNMLAFDGFNNTNNTQLVTRHMSMKAYYQIWRNWILGD